MDERSCCQIRKHAEEEANGEGGADAAQTVGRLLPRLREILQTGREWFGEVEQQGGQQPAVLPDQLPGSGCRRLPHCRVSNLRKVMVSAQQLCLFIRC